MSFESRLRNMGFVHIQPRDIWISHGLRKCISHVVARDEKLLAWALYERTDPGEFWFYQFREPTEPEPYFQILKEIGLSHLQPLVRLNRLYGAVHTAVV